MTAMDAARVKRLRVRCACGADIGLPLDGGAHCPARCFRCASPLPAAAIDQAAADLRWMSEVSADSAIGFRITFEGDDA